MGNAKAKGHMRALHRLNDPRSIVAIGDFVDGALASHLWRRLAWYDLLARYRRSWLGPFWLVLTSAIFIGALSLVYSTLFKMEIRVYVPYVAIGITLWGFITAVALEGISTFVEAESYVKQTSLNPFIYVLRVVWRNILIFAHQFSVALIVTIALGGLSVGLLPLAIVGLGLFLLQAVWVVPILGIVGTRYRDLHPIIANLLQVLFFVTPIFWLPSMLNERRWIADLNPFNSLLAVVREPLLGHVPTAWNYAVVVIVTVIGFALAMLFYGRFKARIIYWL